MDANPTLFQILDSFINVQLGVLSIKPLRWPGPDEAVIGLIRENWCRDTIWIRYRCGQEPTSSGITRRASIQFTRDQERREDEHNCSLFCALNGTEHIIGKTQKFKFEILPFGKIEAIKVGPQANFFLIVKILTLFHYTYGNFHLEDKLE